MSIRQLILFLSLVAATGTSSFAQLNGTYIIDGGGGGDYTNFANAINDLNTLGVNGPVVFEVTDGNYYGRATIGTITGASAVNTVTFRGQSLDSSLVTWSETTSTTVSVFSHNSLLRLNGAQYVTVEHMTMQRTGASQYGHVVFIEGATSHITIQHCKLRGAANFTTTPNDRNLVHAVNNTVQSGMVFRNNRLEYGNRGIYWNATALEADEVLFEGNDLFQSPCHIQGASGSVEVIGNTALSTLTYQGFTLMNLSGVVDISKNSLRNTQINNTLVLQGVAGTSVTSARLANNMVIGQYAASLSACAHLDLLHNSFSGSSAIANSNTDLRSLNNIWYRDVGYALTVTSGATFVESDHNCYFSAAAGTVNWLGTHASQASLTAATGMDANSLFMDPLYVNPLFDLHLQSSSPCAGTGTSTPGLTDDLDQEVRPRPALTDPDMGADETDEHCTVLSGTYVIGPSAGADFSSFTGAIIKMVSCGINGPVVFEVEDGTYNEQLVLPPVPGNSSTNTITFRGQSLDSSLVTLDLNAGNLSANNFLLSFQGMDHVTFEHMRFRRLFASTTNRFARIVSFQASSDPSQQVTLSHIWFQGSFGSPYGYGYSEAIDATDTNDNLEVVVDHCHFSSGGPSIDWDANGSDDRLTVSHCVIANMFDGISIRETISPFTLTDNAIGPFPLNIVAVGITLNDISSSFIISRNSVRMTRGWAARSTNINCTVAEPGLIANNTLIGYSTFTLEGGLQLNGSIDHLHILNNSLSAGYGRAFQMTATNATGLRFVNNIAMVSFGPGYPIYASLASFAECSHNLLYKPVSGNIAFWAGTNYSNMFALQTGSGYFASSFFDDPMFVNPATDLHLQPGSPCAGIGQVLTEFTDDLDGDPRPDPIATAYDIGADETPDQCIPMSGTYIIGPSVAADVPNFLTAVGRMQRCGISGPVLFLVEPGNYFGQVRLPAIAGNDATNTITFEGQTGDSTDVILRANASNVAADNHVVLLEGADHVTFRYLSIARQGVPLSTNYAAAVRFAGSDPSTHARFERCELTSVANSSWGLHQVILDQCTADQERMEMIECRLDGGYTAVRIDHGGNDEEVHIVGNVFEDCSQGIRLAATGNAVSSIMGNDLLSMNTSTYAAIEISGGSGTLEVRRNRVISWSTCIELVGLISSVAQPTLVVNNSFVSTNGAGVNIASSSANVQLLNNSVSASTVALAGIGTGTGLVLRNNIFRNTSSPATVRLSAARISACDRNIYHRSSGSTGVEWDFISYATIAALNGATGMDANSHITEDLYLDPLADLHTCSMLADAGAGPEPVVLTDLGGVPRDPSTPDIGCYEFTPQLWNEQFDLCGAADPITSTGSGQDQWIYKDRKVVARFNDNGQVLGTVDLDVYINSGAMRQSPMGQYYLDRNWHLTTSMPFISPATIRLFHTGSEFAALAAADPLVNMGSDAGVAHYAGPMEDCDLLNDPEGNVWTPTFPASSGSEPRIAANGGTFGHSAILSDDGELYITITGSPLPVELIRFTAERTTERDVALQWTTAAEHDNAGFELWRMIDGEDGSTQVGWVPGTGEGQSIVDYGYSDHNSSDRTSYYTLKLVDRDGSYRWGPMVAVEGGGRSGRFIIRPNPATDDITVAGLPADATIITLHDVMGRERMRWSANGELKDLAHLPRGLYFVTLHDGRGPLETERLVLH